MSDRGEWGRDGALSVPFERADAFAVSAVVQLGDRAVVGQHLDERSGAVGVGAEIRSGRMVPSLSCRVDRKTIAAALWFLPVGRPAIGFLSRVGTTRCRTPTGILPLGHVAKEPV